VLLYLIRHGQAEDHAASGNDDDRVLTESGAKELRRLARRLHDLGVRFDHTLTSPLARARQTADLLVKESVTTWVEDADFLAPGGQFDELRAWLGQWRKRHNGPVAAVGHQPSLGEWAELLVCGEVYGRIPLKKAGIAAVELPDAGSPVGRSILVWLTSPKQLL
jgi:phosphohistidine phosphatase